MGVLEVARVDDHVTHLRTTVYSELCLTTRGKTPGTRGRKYRFRTPDANLWGQIIQMTASNTSNRKRRFDLRVSHRLAPPEYNEAVKCSREEGTMPFQGESC